MSYKTNNEPKFPKRQPRKQAATDISKELSKKRKKRTGGGQKRLPKRRGNKTLTGAANHLLGVPHPCIVHYASALTDPSGTPQGACVPYGFPVPTQRVKTMLRGNMNLGTTGQGYVSANMVISNDQTCVVNTNPLSVGTGATALSSFTNTTNTNNTRLPYTNSQMVANTTGRVVACCLRIRYTGTEASRNGIVTSIEQPSESTNRLSALPGSVLNQYTSSKNERPDPLGSWHSVNYSGPQAANQAALADAVTWQAFSSQLVCYVTGLSGDAYEWEFWGHYEFSGNLVPGMAMSHSDMGMFGKVVESLKSMTVSEPLSDHNSKGAFSTFFSDAGSSVWNYIKKQGMTIALDTISKTFLPPGGRSMMALAA